MGDGCLVSILWPASPNLIFPGDLADPDSTYFILGTIDRFDRNLEAVEAYFAQAQNMWIRGDQMRTDPFNAACVYKMGCATLEQGKPEAAM